jgi:ketosteroid isomerase-like protein
LNPPAICFIDQRIRRSKRENRSAEAVHKHANGSGGLMSQEEIHVALLREAYQKWNDTKAGSVDHWLKLMTDDVNFRSLAAGAAKMEFTRTSTCKEEVKRYFAQLTDEWEMNHYIIDEYIAQDDRVAALGSCSFRNRKTGKILDTPKADFHRFRDGKICEFFEFYDTAQAISSAT